MCVADLMARESTLAVLAQQRATREPIVDDAGTAWVGSSQGLRSERHRIRVLRRRSVSPVRRGLPTKMETVDLTDEELRLCGDVAGKRVLDLGCGRGESCVTFASRGAKVIGIDQSADDLAYARRLAEEEERRVELRHGDLADLAFLPPASVDVAFSAWALSYVTDTGRVFRQVHRVLKTGAPFVFSVVHPALAPRHELVLGRIHDRRSLRRAAARELRGRHAARARARAARFHRHSRRKRSSCEAASSVSDGRWASGSPTTHRACRVASSSPSSPSSSRSSSRKSSAAPTSGPGFKPRCCITA